MTRQEAIETLKANYPDACYEQLREAVDTAISALQAQDVPDTNVGDTISRQAAIDAFLTLGFVWDDSLSDVEKEELDYAIHGIMMAYKERIEQLSSAQSEIIRCKDCKKNPHWEWVGCPMTGKNTRKPNDFCSYAERRTDE